MKSKKPYETRRAIHSMRYVGLIISVLYSSVYLSRGLRSSWSKSKLPMMMLSAASILVGRKALKQAVSTDSCSPSNEHGWLTSTSKCGLPVFRYDFSITTARTPSSGSSLYLLVRKREVLMWRYIHTYSPSFRASCDAKSEGSTVILQTSIETKRCVRLY